MTGSFTDQAGREILKKKKINLKNIDFVYLPDAKDLMNFVKKGHLAVLPIENSTGGTVTQFLDLFPDYDFEILNEYFMEINQTLLAKTDTKMKDIKKVYSHPQSLLQCSDFLNENNFTPLADSDNSTAAKHILEMGNDVAALGGEILADIYGLKILKRKVQNSKNNVTRFLLIQRKGLKNPLENKLREKKRNKISLIFETKDLPGVLYKCLGAFATNNINMSKIESRPHRGKENFNYFFMVDLEGNLENQNIKNALAELDFFTEKVKILGNY